MSKKVLRKVFFFISIYICLGVLVFMVLLMSIWNFTIDIDTLPKLITTILFWPLDIVILTAMILGIFPPISL